MKCLLIFASFHIMCLCFKKLIYIPLISSGNFGPRLIKGKLELSHTRCFMWQNVWWKLPWNVVSLCSNGSVHHCEVDIFAANGAIHTVRVAYWIWFWLIDNFTSLLDKREICIVIWFMFWILKRYQLNNQVVMITKYLEAYECLTDMYAHYLIEYTYLQCIFTYAATVYVFLSSYLSWLLCVSLLAITTVLSHLFVVFPVQLFSV